jgi:DNA-binding CsgD family transcriptional regulator
LNNNCKILIIEPSVIILEGISELIKSIDVNVNITCIYSLNNSFKLNLDEPFRIILINPVIFNNSINNFNKFSVRFKGMNRLGLISTYYNRNLCSDFIDYVYLNDDKETILNTITKYLKSKPENNIATDNSLSKREKSVLKLLANGKSHKEIAEELFISIHTVVTHRKNISSKLGIKSTAALAIYAAVNNIIDLNDPIDSFK